MESEVRNPRARFCRPVAPPRLEYFGRNSAIWGPRPACKIGHGHFLCPILQTPFHLPVSKIGHRNSPCPIFQAGRTPQIAVFRPEYCNLGGATGLQNRARGFLTSNFKQLESELQLGTSTGHSTLATDSRGALRRLQNACFEGAAVLPGESVARVELADALHKSDVRRGLWNRK